MLDESIKSEIIETTNLTQKSLLLINALFKDINDRGGCPYVGHLIRVGDKFVDENKRIVGYLHDVVEDTDVDGDELVRLGFLKEIVDSVLVVTKKDGEMYSDFIDRIIESKDVVAIEVKRSDLEDNMDMKRLKTHNQDDYDRLEKYKIAYEKINKFLENIKGE